MAPIIYYGGVRVKPRAVAALQRATYDKFPTVTVVNVADVLEIVQQVVDQIALVVRFISMFAILAGVVILASSVAGTRFRRIREVVILKTLGATRKRVAGIFSVEFLVLGAVAGLMGSLLATAFSALLLKRWLDADFRLDLAPNLVCIVLTALVRMPRVDGKLPDPRAKRSVTTGGIGAFSAISRVDLERTSERGSAT
jgi:putative ABC transport system permease protein